MYYLIVNFLIFSLSFFVLSFLNIPHKKKEQFLFLQLSIQLLYVHVLKDYTTLPDLREYVLGYNYARSLTIDSVDHIQWYHKFELGWCYLNFVLSKFCAHHILLFFITSSIIIGSYSYLSWRYSVNPLFSLFLFFFLLYGQSLFVLRQNVAMALCFLTIPYILERKIKPFLLIILIAFFIHKTALVFLVIYYIYQLDLNKKNLLFLIGCGGSVIVCFSLIISMLSSYISGFEGYITKENAVSTNYVMFLIQFCVFILFLISDLKMKTLSGINKLLFLMLIVGMVMSFASVGLNSILGRFNMYFTSIIFLTIPTFLNFYYGNLKGVLNLIVFILFMLLFFRSTEYIKEIQLITLF